MIDNIGYDRWFSFLSLIYFSNSAPITNWAKVQVLRMVLKANDILATNTIDQLQARNLKTWILSVSGISQI